MRDVDVRTALRSQLLAEHSHELESTRFVDELQLCGVVRADVAVLNGNFTGYELKSAKDTLDRLPKQVEIYSKIFDYAVLIVAENHLTRAEQMIPEWWGLSVATGASGEVSIRNKSEPSLNPGVDAHSLVTLLWRDETLEILTRLSLEKGIRSKPKRVLWDRLAASVPLDQLRELVRSRLKERQDWRPDLMRLLDDGMCSIASTS